MQSVKEENELNVLLVSSFLSVENGLSHLGFSLTVSQNSVLLWEYKRLGKK